MDLRGVPLNADVYEAWRLGLAQQFSVPTALAIAGTKAEFASLCSTLGLDTSPTSPPPPEPPELPVAPTELEVPEVWRQESAVAGLRRCANDLGITPSPASYRQWRASCPDPDEWLSADAMMAKGWRWQLGLAGLRVEHLRRTDAEIWAHVQFIRDQLGVRVTRPEYEAFRTANPHLRLVTPSTLKVRTGKKWSELFGRR